MKWRPQILAGVLVLGVVAIAAITYGMTDVATGAATGIALAIFKLAEGE